MERPEMSEKSLSFRQSPQSFNSEHHTLQQADPLHKDTDRWKKYLQYLEFYMIFENGQLSQPRPKENAYRRLPARVVSQESRPGIFVRPDRTPESSATFCRWAGTRRVVRLYGLNEFANGLLNLVVCDLLAVDESDGFLAQFEKSRFVLVVSNEDGVGRQKMQPVDFRDHRRLQLTRESAVIDDELICKNRIAVSRINLDAGLDQTLRHIYPPQERRDGCFGRTLGPDDHLGAFRASGLAMGRQVS
jgi:hypothetical protein